MNIYLKKLSVLSIALIAILQVVQTQAQTVTKKYGEDSVECITNLSLYREVFKQNNYKEAYPTWKSVLESCPLSSENIFVNGPVILDYFITNEKDSTKKEEYIQELLDLYYTWIKYYPAREGYCMGQIGTTIMKYRRKEYKKALECMEKSIELEGKGASNVVMDVYFQTSEMYMKVEKLGTEVLIEAYDKITEVLDAKTDDCEIKFEKVMQDIYTLNENLENGTISQEDYQATYEDRKVDSAKAANELTQIKNVNNNMNVRFVKYATCDILIPIYTKKFETSKDMRTLQQIVKFFTKENCTDNDLFISAVEELYKLTPNANIAFYMGSIKYKKGEYNEALTYLNQAIEMFEKGSDKIKAYLLIAECYRQLKQYSTARDNAYKILKINPNDGRAYIFVGSLYMATASSCNTEVPGAAYWAAADKFAKAKAIDPQVADEAQKQLNAVSGRFPKTETYFNHGLSKGQSYKIECWINETTTIR